MRFIHQTKFGNRLGMPLEAWPLPDQIAWKAAFAPGDFLLDAQPDGRDLREATKLTMGTCYARWLVWLRDNQPDALALAPGDRATQDEVKTYLRSLHPSLEVRTIFSYAARLKQALELIAPARDWSWFTPLLGALASKARTAGPTRAKPVVPSDQLFDFGIEVMDQVEETDGLDAVEQAESYRDGLIIGFLAMRPLRLKNMRGLQIGRNFFAANDGYEVALTDEETKTRVDLEFPVPRKLTPYVERYLDHYRKILQAGPFGVAAGYADQADYLWLARSGRQFPVASFEEMISSRTTEHFGIRLTPHGFRHCAATTVADNTPEDYHIIRIILGHTTITTSLEYYNLSKHKKALLMVQENVVQRRKQAANRMNFVDALPAKGG